MEILLLQDINGIGKKNDLLVVGDGFALNCLLPQRKALVATPTVRRRYAEVIKKRAEEKEKEKGLQQAAVSAMSGKTVQFSRKASKTGKLYAALTAPEIVEAVAKQLDMELKAENIVIEEPLKTVGSTQVKVKVGEALIPLSITIAEQK